MSDSEFYDNEQEEPLVEENPQEGVSPEEAVRKVIELEVTEPRKIDLLKKFISGKFRKNPFIALLPTRDFGHGRTHPIDEYKAMSDYEISLHLANLHPTKFSKAAAFFYLLSIQDVNITKSREGFLIKALRTFWSGTRKDEDENENWFISPKTLVGLGKKR